MPPTHKTLLSSIGFLVLLSATSSVRSQNSIPDSTNPEVKSLSESDSAIEISSEARPIVARFNAYYKSIVEVSCAAELSLSMQGTEFDETILMQARAKRPGRVEVLAFDPIGAFPTSQFVSDGNDLFELSLKRNVYMISKMSSSFEALYQRTLARSAPNLPVEVFLALLSERPMQNLMKLSVEPGLIRKLESEIVNGTPCDVLVVNEKGSRAWVASEGAPRLMRYQNSEVVSRPRYLPRGAMARGLDTVLDFKKWVDQDTGEDWNWSPPDSAQRMATLHENADGPGPESGYTSMQLQEETPEGEPGLETSTGRLGFRRFGTTTDLPSTGLEPGTPAPDVSLSRVDGTTVTLDELRKNRPAVLIFWIPGEKFTQAVMARVIAAGGAFSDQVALIPIGVGGDSAEVIEFISNRPGFEGSLIDVGGKVARAFEVGMQPGIVLVDSDGTIRRNLLGPRPRLDERLQSQVTNMISTPRESSESGIRKSASPAVDSDGDSPANETNDDPASS